MRAYLLVNGRNVIDYLKICSDGRSTGTGEAPDRYPIYEVGDLVLGVLICMDVEHQYRLRVRGALLASSAPTKLLCVPADMHGDWFSSEPVLGWNGVHLALSNNVHTYPKEWRARNQVVSPTGYWLARQSGVESVRAAVA